jgi:multiple sugar transport system permease protein
MKATNMSANLSNRNTINAIMLYLILTIFTIIILFPFLIMVSTSLKSEDEVYMQERFSLIPDSWKFSNFIEAMKVADWGRYFLNSFFVTSVTVAGSLFLNGLAGYSFGVLRFPYRNVLFLLLLVGIIIPPQTLIIPQYIILRSIPLFGGNNLFGQGGYGWLDSYWALIIPQLSGSFGIFLFRQYYLGVPRQLYEASKIDGCGSFATFIRIYFPLSKPVIASLAILKSVAVWNDFFYPLIMTSSDDMRTVQLGLQSYRGFALFRWDLMMAACMLVSLPLILAFFVFQKHFIETAFSSGVKG